MAFSLTGSNVSDTYPALSNVQDIVVLSISHLNRARISRFWRSSPMSIFITLFLFNGASPRDTFLTRSTILQISQERRRDSSRILQLDQQQTALETTNCVRTRDRVSLRSSSSWLPDGPSNDVSTIVYVLPCKLDTDRSNQSFMMVQCVHSPFG